MSNATIKSKILLNKVLIIALIFLMLLVITACNNTETPDLGDNINGENNNNDGGNNGDNNGNIDNEHNDNEPEDIFSLTADATEANVTITGFVRDVYFVRLPGIEILFGMSEESVAAVSDVDGSFTIYIKISSPGLDTNKIFDLICLDGTEYNYNIIRRNALQNKEVIDVVCSDKDSGIDVFNLLSYGNKVSFHESGLPLPEGYMSREEIVSETVNGETVIRGVEFYIGDYLLETGNNYGFFLENVYPGTIITVKKEGFYFVMRSENEDKISPLIVTEGDSVYDNSFIAPPYDNPFPFQIRGVLKDGISIQDLDL